MGQDLLVTPVDPAVGEYSISSAMRLIETFW
jgi:hypothetical protein